MRLTRNVGGLFELDFEEFAILEKWYKEIIKERGDDYFGPIGGAVSYKITPTSIGTIIKAQCEGKEITLRDLE